MESTYLKTFLEVAKTGNLTRASETLNVTQSAVSRRIKFLEDQYETPLFNRTGPVLTLTYAGTLVREKAQRILKLEQDLLSGLAQIGEEKQLTFACTPTFGVVHLPEVLRKFMLTSSSAGKLKLAFDMPENIVKGLKEGRYDFAVAEHCKMFPLGDVNSILLSGDEMIFCGSPELGLSPQQTDVEALFPLALFGRDEGCCSKLLLENNLNRIGSQMSNFRKLVIYDDLQLIVQSLLDGLGIAFISSDLVKTYVDEGRLVAIKVDGFIHQRNRSFLFPDNLVRSESAKIFEDCLFAYFELPTPDFDAIESAAI